MQRHNATASCTAARDVLMYYARIIIAVWIMKCGTLRNFFLISQSVSQSVGRRLHFQGEKAKPLGSLKIETRRLEGKKK